MSEASESLKRIGIEKIHEDTHITRGDIEIIFAQDYKLLNQVQYLGFLSILQREYNLDLSSLREEALLFYKEKELSKDGDQGVFVVAKRQKSSTQMYLVVIILIFLAAVILSLNFNSEDENIEIQSVESQVIQDVKKEIIKQEIIENNTSETNATELVPSLESNTSAPVKIAAEKEVAEAVAVQEKEKPVELKQFIIKAKSKVWIGYIDVETNKKHSETVKDKLILKRDKEWLLILGHSHVDIRANGEKYKFSTKGQLRLLYKDGVVTQITEDEFKKLNRGRKW